MQAIEDWPVNWANEIMPIATEAYGKLSFHENSHGWSAHAEDSAAYDKWAAEQATVGIGRAGFRLAAVLKTIWPDKSE